MTGHKQEKQTLLFGRRFADRLMLVRHSAAATRTAGGDAGRSPIIALCVVLRTLFHRPGFFNRSLLLAGIDRDGRLWAHVAKESTTVPIREGLMGCTECRGHRKGTIHSRRADRPDFDRGECGIRTHALATVSRMTPIGAPYTHRQPHPSPCPIGGLLVHVPQSPSPPQG